MKPSEQYQVTPEYYLIQERLAATKSEYIQGDVYAMAGASRAHNQISVNLVTSLGSQLLDKSCSVYASDMKVKITKNYTYPDVLVACDPQQFTDDQTEILLNPVVIIEILSEATEAYDRGLKFSYYQLIESLTSYLLVAQKRYAVEWFERQSHYQWLYTCFSQPEEIVELPAIRCQFTLKEIYHKVQF